MNVFTKRNALVGFVTLKALERRLGRRKRNRARRAAAIGIGVVSLGALAGLAVLLLRRHHGEEEAADASVDEGDIAGESGAGATEPIPAA